MIKNAGKDVRGATDLSERYDAFEIVTHRDEIVGSFERRCLAVKISEDDLERWAVHAYLRLQSKRGTAPVVARRREPTSRSLPTTQVVPPAPAHVQRKVVQALLDYGSRLALETPNAKPTFTPDPNANDLILTDPFAFLLAVICD